MHTLWYRLFFTDEFGVFHNRISELQLIQLLLLDDFVLNLIYFLGVDVNFLQLRSEIAIGELHLINQCFLHGWQQPARAHFSRDGGSNLLSVRSNVPIVRLTHTETFDRRAYQRVLTYYRWELVE